MRNMTSWRRRATKKTVTIQQSTHTKFDVKHFDEFENVSECPLFQGISSTSSSSSSSSTSTSSSLSMSSSLLHDSSISSLSPPVHITGHADDRIFSVTFAPDGHDCSRLWSLFETPPTITSTKSTEKENIDMERKWIATCGQDGTCRIWCLEHNKQHEQVSECYVLTCSEKNECLRMSWGEGLTREIVATSNAEGVIHIWDVLNEQTVQKLNCRVHDSNGLGKAEKPQVYVCKLFGGQSSLVMGGYDDRIMIWDVSTGGSIVEWTFSKTGKKATSMKQISPNHNPASDECYVYGASLGQIHDGSPLIAAALSDGSISIIDPRQASSNISAYRWKAHNLSVSDVTMPSLNSSLNKGESNPSNHDPWSMVSCSADCLVKVWDLRAIRNGAVYSLPGHKKAVFGVDFWSKNNVISWSNDGSLRQWDVTGKSPPVLLYEDLHYNLHGCDNRGAYVATCGGPSGTNHQPAYWNIHKIVSPTTNKSTPTKL